MKKGHRKYVLKARARRAAETRMRIVEAMVQLHQELGPAKTTVSAIAELAGVERLTVYRHFRGEAEMLAACSQHFFQRNPAPHPGLWVVENGHEDRTTRGLGEIYAFYSRTAPMLEKVYRDENESEPLKRIMSDFDAHLRSLAADLASAWPADTRHAHRLSILRHAVRFQTWQSLEADGVANAQKVELMLEWLAAAPIEPARLTVAS